MSLLFFKKNYLTLTVGNNMFGEDTDQNYTNSIRFRDFPTSPVRGRIAGFGQYEFLAILVHRPSQHTVLYLDVIRG